MSLHEGLFDLVAVARRLELCEGEASRRVAEAAASLFPDSGASWAKVGGGLAIYTGKMLPINRATGMGMNSPLTQRDWEDFESFFVSRGFPPQLDVCPVADASLFRLLFGSGYGLSHFLSVHATNAVSFGAARIHEGQEAIEVNEIEVNEVDPGDQSSVEQWIHIVTGGFTGRANFSELDSRIFIAASNATGTRLYLAGFRGRLAGGGLLRIIGQTALLSTASTLPGLRGCGVQAALLAARMRDAFQSGCDLVGVMASPGSASQRNILRAGFHEVYTKPVFTKVVGQV